MSYRFNILDIVVGVGMCAIVFGALLFFLAANGALQGAPPMPLAAEQPFEVRGDMAALQPMLGRAIVDEAILVRRSEEATSGAATDWLRATLARQELEALPGGPLGAVMREAGAMPAVHAARVQAVMGRAIVNFTKRGVRNGLLARGGDESMYNARMIAATEALGQRMDADFVASWQAILGRRIVESIQDYTARAGAIQERLGDSLVRMAQAGMGMEEGRSESQYRLASLAFATRQLELTSGPSTAPVERMAEPIGTVMAATPATWPDIPMAFLVMALLAMAAVFMGGIILAASSREAKAMADRQRDAARWVFRMAS